MRKGGSALLGLALGGLTMLGHAPAQTVTTPMIRTPAPGTAQRQAILNALRLPVMRTFDQKLISFRVTELKVGGLWAFVRARPMNAANEFLRDPQTGAPEVWALLQKNPAGWRVRRWAMPTDVISETWAREFPEVPAKLWPRFR